MPENPRNRHFNLGLYRSHMFNEKDFTIKRILGFYAEQFLKEEDYNLVLRQMTDDFPTSHLILHSSEVLDSREGISCYVLYMSIKRIAQSQPKLIKRVLGQEDDSPLGHIHSKKDDGFIHPIKSIKFSHLSPVFLYFPYKNAHLGHP